MDENKEQNDAETKDEVAKVTETKVKDKHDVQHLAKREDIQTRNNFGAINFFDEKQMVAAESFLKRIMRSEKGGIKTIEEGFAILMRAQDLGLPFSTCIEHIHVINGKTGVDIHIIKALLSKAGCTWECTKDYQPLYEYTDGINVFIDGSFPDYVVRCKNQKEAEEKSSANADDNIYVYPVKYYKDLGGNIYKDYQLAVSNKFSVALNKAQMAEITKSGKIPVYRIANMPVDYITEYVITRTIRGKEVKGLGRFSYNEAIAAKMFDKDTYQKYPRILISHRAFTYAAREVASDILFGVMETTELKIVAGKELGSEELTQFEEAEIVG